MIPMATKNEVKGKVIRIISPQGLIVDIGTRNGIATGNKLIIYEEGQSIIGLDGKNLGKVEFVKATVCVTHAQENFSIAENIEIRDSLDLSGSIARSLTYIEQLPVSEKQIEPLTGYDRTIKKGDLVRLI